MIRAIVSASLLCLAVASSAAEDKAREPDWFPVGEKFTYRLYWGPLRVGLATIWSERAVFEGRPCIALKYHARTTSVLAKIFPVNDYIESLVDPAGFRALRYRQLLHEGRHYQDEVTLFDHEDNLAYHTDRKKHRSRSVMMGPGAQDALTFMYYMRSRGFSVGQNQRYQVFVDDKAYELTMVGIKDETVNLKGLGKVPCVKLEPRSTFGKIYKSKGRVFLWVSRDDRRIITRMSGRVPMASMRAVLIGVAGPGGKWPKS
jgi:hypothetical protein